MLNDAQLIFDSNASLVVAAPGQPSSLTIDLMGGGVGTAPVNYFGVQDAVAGEDIGIGDGASPPVLNIIIGTTFITATAATLRVQLQASVDSGAPGYTPLAWKTLIQTDDLPASVLTAGTKIAECTWPPRYPGQAMPRYLRLNYLLSVAGSSFTAGTIAIANINTGRDDDTKAIYPSGF
jgi:hypothetical protein